MMKTESDLMKGIDDKFQKLLSQFEMNMNILEMKSKRQQFLIEKTNDDDNVNPAPVDVVEKMQPVPEIKHIRPKVRNLKGTPHSTDYSSAESGKDVFSDVSSKDRRETGSDKSESMITVKEIDMKARPKPKTYTMKLQMQNNEVVKKENDDINDNATMGNVLKYISECAEMQNRKNKKRKKTISFSGPNEPVLPEHEPNETSSNLTGEKKKLKKKKSPITASNENLSGSSSKKKSNKSNQEVVRKCSKTVTNISKKGKKRNLRNANNNSKDWISFNRNNAGKAQKSSKSKTQLFKKDEVKHLKKTALEKAINVKKEIVITDLKQNNKIEHFDSVENKLINDFFKSDIFQTADIKNKNKINDLMRKTPDKIQFKRNNDERISFRTKTPLKVIPDAVKMNEFEINDVQEFLPKKINVENKKNILTNSNGLKKENKLFGDGKKLLARRSLTNNKENNQRLDRKMPNKFEDRKSIVSNLELDKTLNDRFKDQRSIMSALDVPRAKSEIKVTSAPSNMFGKGDDGTELEDVKVELDEFFSEIPFVVGRSISRTFNLGLSFQHAMSMLKRVHSKKEVKDVLSIGRPESVPYSESIHCLNTGGTCEAMYSSDWTKEDEEAWEENPWDAELNRRRPKCTCLPNNCTTLKNVLKQLTIKNPGFNMRSLQPSISSTTNKLDFDTESLKKPGLKRAKSQTRTELLRNIRTIQIQLTPSTEILK